jgi:diguanylate cyclase (GGDEF)-like protein
VQPYVSCAPGFAVVTGAISGRASIDEVRSSDPAVRLLEDSWNTRERSVGRRELVVEAAAGALFLLVAVPLALAALGSHELDVPLAGLLVAVYALTSRMIAFPIGAGNVVPSYLVLVPMLLLLPPGVVPLLTAAGLVAGAAGEVALGRGDAKRVLFALPDAWHALGPAAVLLVAGPVHSLRSPALVYAAAFVAGCLFDLLSATLRERATLAIASRIQLRVSMLVWLVDAGIAPLGLLLAHAMRRDAAAILMILPLNGVLWLFSRERNANLGQAQLRLDLAMRERARLQAAVGRLGEALAAKLDLAALTEIVLHGSIEALDAGSGLLSLSGATQPHRIEVAAPAEHAVLRVAVEQAADAEQPCQIERDGVWALALPLGFSSATGNTSGAIAVGRAGRAFREDEEAVMRVLVDRAREAAADIVAHERLRDQALTDALTKLGNRRKLAADMQRRLQSVSPSAPLVLILFDLDGFKGYNDTFGHQAGDAILTRLAEKLAAAVADNGSAYRLGGDEFCVLLAVAPTELDRAVAAAAEALEESGENFAVGASYGAVLLPHEASTLDRAIALADERMYTRKRGRTGQAGRHTRDVLIEIMRAKQPSLCDHSSQVAELCVRVGRRAGMSAEQLDELARAAELHDVGKVGVPDAILDKPGPLSVSEWELMHQHTILGERILAAAPAMRPVAELVRSSHERWDGRGYPDGLAAGQIPLGARIIAACEAYDAMTGDRCYRAGRSEAAAREELRREAGRQFDATVVDLLLAVLDGADTAPDLAANDQTRRSTAGEVAAYLHAALERPRSEQSALGAAPA